ncbi:YsnF/AvaK domain-containing protein [Azospirillum sp. sgz301742]
MPDDRETVVPLHEETISVGKRRVERGRVRVTTKVTEHQEIVRQALEQEDVEVTRVPVDREVDARPEIRQDGDTTIIPLVEEVLVVERRLVLREEIHVRRTKRTVQAEQPVTLRSEGATIERIGGEPIEEPGGRGAGAHPQPEE